MSYIDLDEVISATNKWDRFNEAATRRLNKLGTMQKVCAEVSRELDQATSKFGPFHSAHEGYGILKEEVDELWDEIKAKQGARDVANLRKEAIQVAAMAMRFIIDICDGDRGQV